MAENTLLLDFATVFWLDLYIYWIIGYPSLLNLKVFAFANFFRLPVILRSHTVGKFLPLLGHCHPMDRFRTFNEATMENATTHRDRCCRDLFLNLKVVTLLSNVKR